MFALWEWDVWQNRKFAIVDEFKLNDKRSRPDNPHVRTSQSEMARLRRIVNNSCVCQGIWNDPCPFCFACKLYVRFRLNVCNYSVWSFIEFRVQSWIFGRASGVSLKRDFSFIFKWFAWFEQQPTDEILGPRKETKFPAGPQTGPFLLCTLGAFVANWEKCWRCTIRPIGWFRANNRRSVYCKQLNVWANGQK